MSLALAGLALGACNIPGETGYVEIRTVPATLARSPNLYLDRAKLDPLQKGVAVLKQRTGTAKLSADGIGGQVALCEIVVRPPRCQCRNNGANRACVS